MLGITINNQSHEMHNISLNSHRFGSIFQIPASFSLVPERKKFRNHIYAMISLRGKWFSETLGKNFSEFLGFRKHVQKPNHRRKGKGWERQPHQINLKQKE